jgi:hypothetical protein
VANPVPNPVQRLRYFDGEYLRSYDFTDEQSYHIEMRRLMNLKLHLYGIVYGLELVMDQNSGASGPYFFSIAHGMAIDRMGREIVVPAPYSLSNVLTAPGLGPGSYEVWICYQESETGLPAAGYLDCNVQNQNTRWQETFQVYFQPMQGPSLVADCGGVRLGVVNLNNNAGLGLQFANQTYNTGRHYVGIRAQSVIAPDQVDTDQYHIQALTTPVPDKPLPGYLDVHPGVFNHGNVFVKKNLVVGDDFALTPGSKPPSSIPTTGNLKVTNDLFLYGNFYGFNPSLGVSGQWCGLQQYIQSMMPDVQTGVWPPINIPNPSPASLSSPPNLTGVASFTLSSTKLGAVSNAVVTVAISSIGGQDPKDLENSWLAPLVTSGFLVTVSAAPAAVGNPMTVNVSWTVGPAVPSGSNFVPPITSLTVSYVAIFFP